MIVGVHLLSPVFAASGAAHFSRYLYLQDEIHDWQVCQGGLQILVVEFPGHGVGVLALPGFCAVLVLRVAVSYCQEHHRGAFLQSVEGEGSVDVLPRFVHRRSVVTNCRVSVWAQARSVALERLEFLVWMFQSAMAIWIRVVGA